MFAIAGRAVARRVPSATAQLLSRPLVIRTALATRSFTIAPSAPLAAPKPASEKSKAKKPSATKKAAAKKKVAAKKKPKKAAPKAKKATPRPVGKPRKEKEPLTPEEEKKQKLRELKKAALLKGAPSTYKKSTWLVYCTERLSQMKDMAFGDALPAIKEDYTNLTASELRDLQATAEAQNEAAKEAEQKFIKSHPVEAIYLANAARKQLSKLTEKHVKLLEDDRIPKQLIGPYTRFVRDRLTTLREETGSSVQEGLKKLGEEWNQLSAEERRPYQEEFEREKVQYDAESEKFYASVKGYKKAQKQAEKDALEEKRLQLNAAKRAQRAEAKEADAAAQASSGSDTYI